MIVMNCRVLVAKMTQMSVSTTYMLDTLGVPEAQEKVIPCEYKNPSSFPFLLLHPL